jgi:hypothetical protein
MNLLQLTVETTLEKFVLEFRGKLWKHYKGTRKLNSSS